MTDLVKLVRGVPLVSTLDIADGFSVEHYAILRLVQKYESRFQAMRTFDFQSQKSGGRPTTFCMMDETQTTFLVSLMRNSDVVVDFKARLAQEFTRMKDVLTRLASQGQNAEWLESRKAGKVTRVLSTDAVKEFVTYAKDQGSQNAERYYANISKMENKALFFLEQEFSNLRDMLNIHQLSTIQSADQIVIKALRDGMKKGMGYKDIYRLAKSRVEGFAEVIGKTLIPSSQLQIGEE
jgi:phage regulator Rha-like protein